MSVKIVQLLVTADNCVTVFLDEDCTTKERDELFHLLSAAPDLLAALERIVSLVDKRHSHRNFELLDSIRTEARAVISKVSN